MLSVTLAMHPMQRVLGKLSGIASLWCAANTLVPVHTTLRLPSEFEGIGINRQLRWIFWPGEWLLAKVISSAPRQRIERTNAHADTVTDTHCTYASDAAILLGLRAP
ncbi:hypothetical protein HDV63DRAFT_374922 [Trichoderma sp. SZMC 28014]